MYINIAHKSIDFYQLYKVFVILLKSHSQYLSSMLIIENQTKTTIVNIKKKIKIKR